MFYCTIELMPWLEAAWAGRVLPKREVPTCIGGSLHLYDTDNEWAMMGAAKREQWVRTLQSLVHPDLNYDAPGEVVLAPSKRGERLMHLVNALSLPPEEEDEDAL